MDEGRIGQPPPVAALDLGTDPVHFNPSRDTGALRRRWGVGDGPLILTVARLVPHKGQDMGIRALATLSRDFPNLRYIMVGEGHDELRLRSIARELGVTDKVGFVGAMRDDELPEAYATSTIYLGASRVDKEINVEGFGISFLEAGASSIPSAPGDSGGVRSAVRDGGTGCGRRLECCGRWVGMPPVASARVWAYWVTAPSVSASVLSKSRSQRRFPSCRTTR